MSDARHGPIDDEYEEGGWGRLIAIAAVVAVVIAAVFFFVGKASGGGDSGPASLADAITQAQKGTLSCGNVSAAVAAARPGGGGTNGAAPSGAGTNGAPPAGAPNAGGFLARGLCGDNAGAQGQGQAGGQGAFAGRGFGGGLTGEVTKVSDSSLTIDTPGGSRTVKIGPDTQIDKTAQGDKSDLRSGVTVSVAGARGNGQGTATRIVIVPARQQQ
jgi:hypothetical protein